MVNIGSKNALFGCFGQQIGKTIVMFKISTLEFVLLQKLAQKKKSLNLIPKLLDLSLFGLEFYNTNVIIEISALDFALLQLFMKE